MLHLTKTQPRTQKPKLYKKVQEAFVCFLILKPDSFTVAVKFGVGVALALVSRLVLIRKSPNTSESSMLICSPEISALCIPLSALDLYLNQYQYPPSTPDVMLTNQPYSGDSFE